MPRIAKRSKRVVRSSRCGAFHHELMVSMLGFHFCPECGQRLGFCRPMPEPAP
jgi:hypothetical protein